MTIPALRIFGIILLLAFAADLFPDDAERDGRRGNELYADEAFDEAAEAFASGLAVLRDDAEGRLRYGLHNNLGAALLKSGDGEGAREAFDRALRAAASDADLARTYYNAGNAAMAARDLEAALDHYRHSLLRNPDSEDAKFNYEFARRQLEQQQQQQEQQEQGDSDESDEEQQQEEPQDSGEQGEEGDQEPQDQNPQDGSSEQEPRSGEQQGQEEPQRQTGAEPSTERVSEAEAERILQALRNEEQQLLRQVQRPTGRPRPVEKDW